MIANGDQCVASKQHNEEKWKGCDKEWEALLWVSLELFLLGFEMEDEDESEQPGNKGVDRSWQDSVKSSW